MSYDKGSVIFYRKQLWFMAIILCFFFFEAWPCMGLEVIYVDIDASSGGNGTSWEEALTSLDVALAGASNCEIWVAKGTYRPTNGTDRDISFNLKSGVALYGGFAGIKGIKEDRNISENETILTGNIGSSDISSDNSYHVVYSNNVDSTAILDGFTITGGNTNFSGTHYYGGGMHNKNSNPTVTNCTFCGNNAHYGGGMYNTDSSPTVTNCTFSKNSADKNGGGMYCYKGNPTVTDCTFSENSTNGYGGGMLSYNSNLTMINCTFIKNIATGPGENCGGGIYNVEGELTVTNCTLNENSTDFGGGIASKSSNLTVANCTFNKNKANNNGAGMYNAYNKLTMTNCAFSGNKATDDGGGMYNYGYSSNLMVTNCTFSKNNSDKNGGGMYSDHSSPEVTNCTFSENNGGGIYNYDRSNPTIANCILWNNSGGEITDTLNSIPTLSYCVISGDYSGPGTIDNIIIADPCLFPLDHNGGPTRTCALGPNSSAIDTGLPGSEIPTKDQRGVPRPQGSGYDIGAYEAEFFNLIIIADGTGRGQVSPDTGVHNCYENTEVTLLASADINSTFVGWGSDISGNQNPVTVTMSKDIFITAEFNLKSTPTPGPEPVSKNLLSVPDRSDALNDIMDGTIILDLPREMTGLSFDSFNSADIDLTSKAKPISSSYISSHRLSEDLEGTFITGLSFDIAANTSPDLEKTGILPLNVTLNISADTLLSELLFSDAQNGVDVFKIIGTEAYNLMDIARETGLPLGDFFSVIENDYGDFHITFGLLIVDTSARDKPPVQPVTTSGDCRFLIFDGEADGRFTDPIVAMKIPHNYSKDNNSSGGCSVTALLPSIALLLVPVILLARRH